MSGMIGKGVPEKASRLLLVDHFPMLQPHSNRILFLKVIVSINKWL